MEVGCFSDFQNLKCLSLIVLALVDKRVVCVVEISCNICQREKLNIF